LTGHTKQLLVHTGQHYDPLLRDVFFEQLSLPEPDVSLDVGSGSHAEQTAAALVGLERVFGERRPDLVVVPGDVNSTLAGALAAVKLEIPVCHVEAGLRSFDRTMPEEHNRRLTDHVSSLLLAHSEEAVVNLAREGIEGDSVAFVGNTMIDSMLRAVDEARALRAFDRFGIEPDRFLLATLHRPALVDDSGLLEQTLYALAAVARELPVVFPAHPRTLDRLRGLNVSTPAAVHIVDPLPYLDFLSLEASAAAVLTDSGGVQEETTVLGVPCFTLRDNTERPVTVELGTNTVLGLAPERVREIPTLLADRKAGDTRIPPLWDGRAGERAAAEIERFLSRAV
jgi:UDP-N-acetylglucosamine 2-epimerase (non-hydrolysing)